MGKVPGLGSMAEVIRLSMKMGASHVARMYVNVMVMAIQNSDLGMPICLFDSYDYVREKKSGDGLVGYHKQNPRWRPNLTRGLSLLYYLR